MSLQTVLDEKLLLINNLDKNWVTFVKDHIDTIKEDSMTVEITDADRDRYIYKFEHFLRDQSCDINLVWIARLINGLNNYEDFTIKSVILIPNKTKITTLYRLYKSSNDLAR